MIDARILALVFLSSIPNGRHLIAQSEKYSVESVQGVYEELNTYESIALNTEFDPLWTYEFNLNFPFPFFDSSYNRVIFDRSSYGAFTDDEDNSLFLFQYYSWTYDPYMGSKDITSDVRYAHVTLEGKQAFVLQFTKVRIFADLYEDSLDTYLNFQLWLFENGVIEVHFGDIHMDNNPIYSPGKGLYCFSSDEGIDTSEICGPYMGIANPFNENDAVGVEGAYNDYSVTGDIYASFTVMPPKGWIIRFRPRSVSTHEIPSTEITIQPNPAHDFIQLPQISGKARIFDVMSKEVFHGFVQDGDLNVSALIPGLYFIEVWSGTKHYYGRFIKE